MWKTVFFPLGSGTKQGCPLFTTSIQHWTGVTSQHEEIKDKEKHNNNNNKRHIAWKEIKWFLFSDDMIIYIENPKKSTVKLPELINEFSKTAGYKVNITKFSSISVWCQWTIRDRFSKCVKDTCTEDYNILLREIKC